MIFSWIVYFAAATFAAGKTFKGTTSSSFDQIVASPLFLDKTLFIKEFLSKKFPKHLAVLAPRKFGKTSQIDALKKFLEFQVDTNGTKITDRKTRKNPFLRANIFTNDTEFFDKHFAKYPVIYFNFNDIKYDTYEEFAKTFTSMVSAEYERHLYLINSKILHPFNTKDFMTFWQDAKNASKKPEPWRYVGSGQILTRILKTFFEKKVILLVDEYDSFKRAYFNEYYLSHDKELKKIFKIVGEFLGNLVYDNDIYIQRSFLTGINPILIPQAKNLEMKSVFESKRLASYFGVTQKDAVKLALMTNRMKDIEPMRQWYSGYCVTGLDDKLFNTQSIFRFVKKGQPTRFWDGAPGLSGFKKLFESKKLGKYVEDALKNGTAVKLDDGAENLPAFKKLGKKAEHALTNGTVKFGKKLTSEDFFGLRDVMLTDMDVSEMAEKRSVFLQFLTENGYFTVVDSVIKVPNQEVRQLLGQLLYENKSV